MLKFKILELTFDDFLQHDLMDFYIKFNFLKRPYTSLLTTESVLSQFFMKVIHGTFGIQKQSFAAIFQKGSRIPEIKNRVTDYNVIKPS